MLSESSLTFLERLLDTPGPSGFEAAPARAWREEAGRFARVRGDVAGNSIAEVNPDGSPTIMLAGHIDEIGLIVTYVDDDGFVYIAPIGGWDPQVLVGQRMRFMGAGRCACAAWSARSRSTSSSPTNAKRPRSSPTSGWTSAPARAPRPRRGSASAMPA